MFEQIKKFSQEIMICQRIDSKARTSRLDGKTISRGEAHWKERRQLGGGIRRRDFQFRASRSNTKMKDDCQAVQVEPEYLDLMRIGGFVQLKRLTRIHPTSHSFAKHSETTLSASLCDVFSYPQHYYKKVARKCINL